MIDPGMSTGPRALALAVAGALAMAPATAQEPASPEAGVGAVAWLAGCWEGVLRNGATYEEAWLVPRAGSMVGVARMTGEGRTLSFEFMRITADEGVLVYAAQPSGRPPTLFRATAVGAGQVTFENPGHDFPQRILYHYTPPGQLHARIEGERDGELRGIDFPLRRVACPGNVGMSLLPDGAP
jgi:hypothetical protein